MMDNKRVLITGETGYVARHLQNYMQAQGIQTDLMSVRDEAWHHRDFSHYSAVVHAAALVHTKEEIPWTQWEAINVTLTRDLAEKARREGVASFVFLSTLAVYHSPSGAIGTPYHIGVDTPLEPDTSYGRSKRMAEETIVPLDCDDFAVLIARCPMIYGKECPGNYKILRRLALRLPILPRHINARSMLFIGTLCRFIDIAIQKKLRGFWIPQDAQTICTVEMMQAIRTRNGKSILPTSRVLAALLPLAAWMISSARKAFGNLTVDPALSNTGWEYRFGDFAACMDDTEPWEREG